MNKQVISDNHKVDFAKRKGKTDEWFTPLGAVVKIVDIISSGAVVWCPFDTEESNFVKELSKTNKVVFSHIDNGEDFFDFEPNKWDIIVSNPPYSLRNKILERAFSFGKPFALLMNTNGLFDSKIRWELFKNNDFTLFYLQGRTPFMNEDMVLMESPPFQSAYICSKIFDDKIVFSK